MLKTEEQEIDGLRVSVTQFPAMYAFRLLARLAKSVGPAFSTLSAAGMDAELETIAPQLAAALTTLDPDECDRLAVEVLKCTSVWDDGKKIELADKARIDQVFSGRILTMFKVLGFALRVNFSDFAAGIGKQAPAAP